MGNGTDKKSDGLKKEKVYITGHRNPDLDSICAAYAFAVLKNLTDKNREYKPVRCGHISESIRKQLELTGMEIPEFMRDVYPKVSDVMFTYDEGYRANDPVYSLIQTYDPAKPSAFPVFDDGKFSGLLSVDDITAWFLKDNSDQNPVYDFHVENIAKVLPGRIIHEGENREFSASLSVGAAAYDDFCRHVDENPDSIMVMGLRIDHIRYAVSKNIPAIIITTVNGMPEMDFSGYKGLIYATPLPTAEAMRRMRMVEPLGKIIGAQAEPLQLNDLFEDVKESFVNSRLRGYAVMDGEQYKGFVTRRCFLKRPDYSVILVDHNEKDQSILGIETANILGIVDHHRLNALRTDLPIFIIAEPVGSTCTIIYEQFRKNNMIPDSVTAKVMLTGIISDTLLFRSPTTTELDIALAEKLAVIAGVDDINEYGLTLLSITESLADAEPEKIIRSDFKKYDSNGVQMGIGQCETVTLNDISKYAADYIKALDAVRRSDGLDWTMLLITDIMTGRSILLTSGYKAEKKLDYVKLSENMYDLPGVMSRKKQLLPDILHSLQL